MPLTLRHEVALGQRKVAVVRRSQKSTKYFSHNEPKPEEAISRYSSPRNQNKSLENSGKFSYYC